MNIQQPTGRQEQVGEKTQIASQLHISSPNSVIPLAAKAECLLNA